MSIRDHSHSLTLDQGYSDIKIKLVFLKNHWANLSQISYETFLG